MSCGTRTVYARTVYARTIYARDKYKARVSITLSSSFESLLCPAIMPHNSVGSEKRLAKAHLIDNMLTTLSGVPIIIILNYP